MSSLILPIDRQGVLCYKKVSNMIRKDIYEHLANIYLDASSKKKKKSKKYLKTFKPLFFLNLAVIFFLVIFLLLTLKEKNQFLNSEVALILSSEAVKINFHFDPARKETYSVDLNKLDLRRFQALCFSVKTLNYNDNIKLRIEFTNIFKEQSETYIKGIPRKWQDYKINFSEFKNISDWSRMSNLSFIIEEWNAKEKNGVVYIDNVRFLR